GGPSQGPPISSTKTKVALFSRCLATLRMANKQRKLVISPVSVEKVPQLRLVTMQRSGYKQASDAAVQSNVRRSAAYDGKPLPFGVAVLLLPPGRSGS